MDMLLETLNNAGSKFVEFALPMLIQSSLLILIILAADLLLKKKVRAVFRYWIWMLVLVKLVLPVSLYSPLSLGSWFGEKIEYKLEINPFFLQYICKSASLFIIDKIIDGSHFCTPCFWSGNL